MIAGNFKNYELTIQNGAHAELDLSTIVTTEKTVKFNSFYDGIRLIVTSSNNVDVATTTDFLLPKDEYTDLELGTGLDRLSFYNGSGGEAKISIAVLF